MSLVADEFGGCDSSHCTTAAAATAAAAAGTPSRTPAVRGL